MKLVHHQWHHQLMKVFKTVSLVVALEEAKIDTTYTVDTKKGVISFYGREVWDSNRRGYGTINLSKAMQVSSNTAIVQMVHDLFGKDPKKFVGRINKMHLNRKLGMPSILIYIEIIIKMWYSSPFILDR